MTERLVNVTRTAFPSKKSFLLSLTIISPVFLGGCALPPAVELASWALTGFSYAATGKGMGDHAMSLALQEDCAIHRLALDGDVCRPYLDDPLQSDTMIASADQDSDEVLEPASGPSSWRQTASTITVRYGADQAAAMPVDF